MLDSLEGILQYDATTGSCSIRNLYLLKELLGQLPLNKATVAASCCEPRLLEDLGLGRCFDQVVEVPGVEPEEALKLLAQAGVDASAASKIWDIVSLESVPHAVSIANLWRAQRRL